MRSKRGPIGLLVLAAAFLVLAVGASSAQAAFGIEKWESLTCKENIDLPAPGGEIKGEPPLEPSPKPCTAATSSQWYTQAAGHPLFGITDFTLNTLTGIGKEGFPDGFVKNIVVDTPEGLSVNPQAVPECPLAVAEANVLACGAMTPSPLVGINYLTVAIEKPGPECVPKCEQERVAVPVFNIEPFFGTPSMVAFPTTTGTVFIVGSLSPVDQHVTFTISNLKSPLEGGAPLVRSRLVFFGGSIGTAGDGTYLTLPSQCGVPAQATLKVDSHEGASSEASFTTPYSGTGCGKVPFDPTIETTVDSSTDSPDPATVDVGIPFDPEKEIANSYLKTATITLPEGGGLNPSVANGLQTCSDAQFKYHTNDKIECPDASVIGTTEVDTPSLPPDSLHGTVYAATPTSNDPTTGNQFRVFLTVESERFGVNVRLIGHVFPNLETGQLKVVVPENPQATFRSFKVRINGGSHGALTTPNTCGPHTTVAELEPWSAPGTTKQPPPTSSFNLTNAPGGGPCPKKLGERPFSPTFTAGTVSHKAGKFSPFELHITRPNGAQEIRRVDVNLPPGMVAKLKGTEYCPEASIAAAATQSGKGEQAKPSCPSNSQVGTVDVGVGSGEVFHTPGKVYLAGPYKGAPLSFVFIVPAVAGPYDLGTDVVRTALNVDPETAQVHAVSDPIPYIFGGVKLDVRSIDVSIDRKSFTVNPTTCREEFQIGSGIFGGGEDPANPAAWIESKPSQGFRATECKKLAFKPSFFAKILGGKNQTKRAKNPKFQATLDARNGDANLRRAAFILPRATILDQSHIKTICTRVQLAANECPKNSIYGHAKATSPLLAKALKGPVYLTSSSHELPDLLVDLHGQVPVRLRGVINSEHGRLKTVFNNTPDVAVDKFVLTMKGGNKGLLINSRNLCSRQTTGFLNLKAQNSRRLKRNNLRLNIPAC